jgi:hypothetical protein
MMQSYLILYVPMNFPSVTVLDKWGLHIGVGIGIGMTTLGLWIRCLTNFSFAFSVIGQTIMALG